MGQSGDWAALNVDLSTVFAGVVPIFARPLPGIGGFELKRISLHPACKLFPKLGAVELQELADDIRQNGLQNAIILLDGKILDGRNRHAACKIAGVEPRFEKWTGNGSPVEWVISQNLMRRHLTASQRAVVALDLLPLLEKEAKQRQRLSNRYRKNGRSAHECADRDGTGRASEAAARIVRSSARYVELVKSIKNEAPELVDLIRCGRLNVPNAKKIAELPKERREQLLASANGDEDGFETWTAEAKPKPRRRKYASNGTRVKATELIHGECRNALKKLRKGSVDLVLADPPYPHVEREYGTLNEKDWHALMQEVVIETRRVLKPTGSAVFILQPTFEKLGKMRLWLWEFLLWAAKEWNLVQDAYWWAPDTLPRGGSARRHGLLRQSVKMCIWLGPPDCYRNQDDVLWETSDRQDARKWSDRALQYRPSGHSMRDGRTAETSALRGGSTPFNLLPIPHGSNNGTVAHPAATPYELAYWWCRYLLPQKGVLLDPFVGSGTMLAAGLDAGARKVIGIDKEKKYLTTAKRRVQQ